MTNEEVTGLESGGTTHLKQFQASGNSGTDVSGGQFSEEYLSALQGPRAAQVWDEMRRSETQVAMLLNAVFNPIKAANWEVEAADANNPEYKKHADFIRKAFFKELDWKQFVHEALTCVPFGFSVFEEVHRLRLADPEFGDVIYLSSMGFRSQKTIEKWNLEKKTGKLLSIEQQVTSDVGGNAVIPGAFLTVFTLNKEGDNYEGISALRPMYGSFSRKRLYLKLLAIGIEKYAVGTPIGTIPKDKVQDKKAVEDFKRVLQSYASHEKSYLTKPEGWIIEVQKNEFAAEKIVEVIKLENLEMVNVLLANFLALGTGGSGGAYALGKDLSSFFLGCIQAFADLIGYGLERKTVRALIDMNFGVQAEYPKIKCSGINDKAGKEFADVIKVLIDGQALSPDETLEDFVRRQFKLPTADQTTRRDVVSGAPSNVNNKVEGAPDLNVQQLSLNGAQVTALLDVLNRVAAGLLPQDTAKALIKTAFNVSDEQVDSILGSLGTTFKIDPAQVQTQQFNESSAMKFADSYKKEWNDNKSALKIEMQTQLEKIWEAWKSRIKSKYDGLPESQKLQVIKQVTTPGVVEYKKMLKQSLAQVAIDALERARKEVPTKKKIKLTEEADTLKLASFDPFDTLPAEIKRRILAQANLIVDTQVADLEKAVYFQFQSSAASTTSIELILKDLDSKIEPMIAGSTKAGMSVDAAAGDAVAQATQSARNAFFFTPEVLEEVESFTFFNEDPVSEICQDLNGQTFMANDPEALRYFPPLHHNCKSRLVPNLKGDKTNPKADDKFGPSEKSLEKFITLKEKVVGEMYRLSDAQH